MLGSSLVLTAFLGARCYAEVFTHITLQIESGINLSINRTLGLRNVREPVHRAHSDAVARM